MFATLTPIATIDGKTAEQWRDESKRQHQAAADSFDRCDTDGFLSQWASDLSGQKASANARLLENPEHPGYAEFTELFDLEGRWVPARTLDTQYGRRWQVLTADGKLTGTFLPYRPKRRETLARKGYVEGTVLRPAKADFEGRGKGLSGTAWVAIKPLTRAPEAPAAIITPDNWKDES